MVFSQSKASKTVADIWANGKKLHVQYSDGSGKDMDVPSSGIQFSRIVGQGTYSSGFSTYDITSGSFKVRANGGGNYEFFIK